MMEMSMFTHAPPFPKVVLASPRLGNLSSRMRTDINEVAQLALRSPTVSDFSVRPGTCSVFGIQLYFTNENRF